MVKMVKFYMDIMQFKKQIFKGEPQGRAEIFELSLSI